MQGEKLNKIRLTIDTAIRTFDLQIFVKQKSAPQFNCQKSIVKSPKSHGAVLLIAVLVASVALAVGFGVYQRTYKELLFGSYWRQTQIAFSSADSGLECAMYWLLHSGAGGPGTASCFGAPIPAWDPKVQSGNFNLTVPGAGCANVTIAWDATVLPAGATTTVVKGYNDCVPTNPRRVERGLGAALSP